MLRPLMMAAAFLPLLWQGVEIPRLGFAAQFTPKETADVLSLAGARTPWMIVGSVPGPVPNGLGIRALLFLRPDRSTETLRRGELVIADSARMQDGTSRPWTKQIGLHEWAQVRDPRQDWAVDGDRDVRRPFEVVGSAGNEEIVELVTLVRANPFVQWAPSSRPDLRRVPGDWPIAKLVRQSASVTVYLLEPRSENSGYAVSITRTAAAWHVVQFQLWLGRL